MTGGMGDGDLVGAISWLLVTVRGWPYCTIRV
jgi:hypothetical protein